MAKLMQDSVCGNCGNKNCVLFCDNEFTDEYCKNCGESNLFVGLKKVETEMPCKDNKRHDIRIARGRKIFCPICYTELGDLNDNP